MNEIRVRFPFSRILLLLGLLALSLPALQRPAAACSCSPGDPKNGLAAADAAFAGSLISRDDPPPAPVMSSATEVTWRFKVETLVKGKLGSEVDVKSPISGASCGFEFEPGARVGLLLYQKDGHWSSGLCSQIDPDALLKAAKPLPNVDPAANLDAQDTPPISNGGPTSKAARPSSPQSQRNKMVPKILAGLGLALAIAVLALMERSGQRLKDRGPK